MWFLRDLVAKFEICGSRVLLVYTAPLTKHTFPVVRSTRVGPCVLVLTTNDDDVAWTRTRTRGRYWLTHLVCTPYQPIRSHDPNAHLRVHGRPITHSARLRLHFSVCACFIAVAR